MKHMGQIFKFAALVGNRRFKHGAFKSCSADSIIGFKQVAVNNPMLLFIKKYIKISGLRKVCKTFNICRNAFER